MGIMASRIICLEFTAFSLLRSKLSFLSKDSLTLALDAGLRESVLLGGRGGVLDLVFWFDLL